MCLRRSKIRLVYAGGNIERATRECARGCVERVKEGTRTKDKQLPKKRKLQKKKEKKRDGIARKLYTFFSLYLYRFLFHWTADCFIFTWNDVSDRILAEDSVSREHRTRSSFCFFFFLILHSRRGRLRRDYDLPSYFFIGGRVSSRGKTMYVCARSTINERVRARSLVFLTYIITRIISP